MYAMVGVAFVGFFLNVVDARNERVWWAVFTIGQAGALAWLGSWVVLIGVGLASWLVEQLSNRGDCTATPASLSPALAVLHLRAR